MYSKEGIVSLISEILEERPFIEMPYEKILYHINLIQERLNELESEYAYRVHMENGLIEHSDELLEKIKILKKVYTYLLKTKKQKEETKINNNKNLKVKNLDETEEYEEKYNLNIPNKIILVPEETEKIETKKIKIR